MTTKNWIHLSAGHPKIIQKEQDWKDEVNTMGDNKKKPVRPEDICIRIVSPDLTRAAYIQRLDDVQKAGDAYLYCKMDEVDMLRKFNDPSQLIRLCWDNSEDGQERVGTKSVTARVKTRFNWNASSTIAVTQKFFREGIERMKGTEQIVTIGMRGDGDEAMSEEADTKLMTNIINDQRKIIADVTGKKASETPQVWALYKEVLDYYDKGMKVPDDVTLLLCDDNWGNVRRVPNAKERKHKGGWGLYYHVDYVGAPRNSKMLNVTPVQNPWEQLTLAYENGIDRLWILNVGDLKPMEYPISQFMDMAWNPHKYDVNNITRHTRDWCAQQFGESQADEAARILNLTCKYNGRCTPEMLDKNTYSLENGEWQEVVNQYLQLEADALRQYNCLPASYHDAYRQIILFPIELMSNLHQMYFAQAQNHALYKQGNPKANVWADECERLFKRDSLICDYYNHKMAGGKWNGMMTQKHIGYKSWNDDFEKDTCPELFRVTSKDGVIISENNGVVEIEAPYYSSKTDAAEAKWTEIPFMGKSVAGVTLMPYTKSVKGASLTYRFKMNALARQGASSATDSKKVRIHIITKSTLDYQNKGGLTYGVSVDGAEPVVVNLNHNLNEKPENIYNIYYPTVASRIIDKVIEIELPVLHPYPYSHAKRSCHRLRENRD